MSSLILSIDSLSLFLSSREIFNNLKLSIFKNDKIGIVGENGSGKSTLLKLILKQIEPDSGNIISDRDLKIGVSTQEDTFDGFKTIKDYIENYQDVDKEEVLRNRYKFLDIFGIEDLDVQLELLSGGQKKKLSIINAISINPELIILDEPTNHLDYKSVSWLEDYLIKVNTPVLVVSHDRYFLNKISTKILDISKIYESGANLYDGGFDQFKIKKQDLIKKQLNDIQILKNKFKNEKDWISRAPKARGTKANFRIKAFEELESQLSMQKSLITRESKVVNFQSTNRQTKELVKAIKVSFSYDEANKILEDFNFVLKQGDVIGVLGYNGQGKTTLLNILSKKLEVTTGKLVQAAFLKVVYFDQFKKDLSKYKTLKEALADGNMEVVYQGKSYHIISWARFFNFSVDDLEKDLNSLSGGERARVLLSKLLLQEADLLILDEPTNDLDIQMLEKLEQMIIKFTGSIVIVSHDRYLLSEICTNFLGFDTENKLNSYASFEQWFQVVNKSKNLNKGVSSNKGKKSSKEIFLKNKELNRIEGRISKLDKHKEKLEKLMATDDIINNQEKYSDLLKEYQEISPKLDKLMSDWEELANELE